MKGIILAGGEGRRLGPATLKTPKPLISIKGKPLINYNLGLFEKHEVQDVKIIVRSSHMQPYDDWRREYQHAFPEMNIDLVAEQKAMGTFGYIFHHLRDWIGTEDVFVTNGDDIKEIDLPAMQRAHKAMSAAATLALMKMEKPDNYGTVVVEGDVITDFVEKQQNLTAGFVSAGMYLIAPSALAYATTIFSNDKRFIMFEKDLFPPLAKAGMLRAFFCKGMFYDCGTPERLERAIREL